MRFWNDEEGIAVGDIVSKCFSILITRDNGESWQKNHAASFQKLQKVRPLLQLAILILSLKAPKHGTWNVSKTPLTQELAMTGMFTADFYNKKIGFAAGGNHDNPKQNSGNKIQTENGGKT